MRRMPVPACCCRTALALLALLLFSCTQDVYDKGEGKYSLMRADFGEAYVNSERQFFRFVTDDGVQLDLTTPLLPKWATRGDSTYRCVCYYNKVKADDGSEMATVLSSSSIPCPSVCPTSALDSPMKTDPVRFESAWISTSGRYLNLSIYLLTGEADDSTASQHLGVVCDSLLLHADGKRTSQLRLYHDQGNVPEYYSTQVYASLPVDSLQGDSVRLAINTYEGVVTKIFRLPRGE
ncbi:MAG: hypothetical protein K5764_07150 [Prevotella sp.]|nr:hypothetical protein [Prevotella sp.]